MASQKMKALKAEVIGLLACLAGHQALAADPVLPAMHQKLIDAWVAKHPQYRLASLDDCRCQDGINEMRTGWGVGKARHPRQKDYLPYYLEGSFAGNPGFAALFRNVSGPFAAKIVVFSVPQGNSRAIDYPFVSEGTLEQVGLFRVGTKLLVGEFGSEAEALEVPRDKK